MNSEDDAGSETFRVSTYSWSAEAGPYLELVDRRRASGRARLTASLANVIDSGISGNRLVIDVQQVGVDPLKKVSDYAPWRGVAMWLSGLGDHAVDIRARLSSPAAPVVVEVDADGNLGVAANMVGTLDWEAEQDLEERLDCALASLGLDLGEHLNESSETSVRERPLTARELRQHLLDAALPSGRRDVVSRSPQGLPEPEGPGNREFLCSLISAALRPGCDFGEFAEHRDASPEEVMSGLDALEAWGLLLRGGVGDPPLVFRAGEQFLACSGEVPPDTLGFLPRTLDDLHSREALRRSTFSLMTEFSDSLVSRTGVGFACSEIVPAAFAHAVDELMAVRLFGAASALCTRLANEEPAGCVAEELVAVSLMGRAADLLELHEALSPQDCLAAVAGLRSLFELFQDDDVLRLFEMSEPSDAAVAGDSEIDRQMGVVDQRTEAWFTAFGWTKAAGHLAPASDFRWG